MRRAQDTVELLAGWTVLSASMPPSRRIRRALPLLALLALGACGAKSDPAPATAPPQNPAPAAPTPLFHDFGSIPHGKSGEHDFVLDLRRELGPGYFTVGTHLDCSCASVQTLLRDAAGNERLVPMYGAETEPKDGELLVVRLLVDTARKEPVDVGPIESHANVLLMPPGVHDPRARVSWPLRFRYSVDSPVRLRPYAVLDFERVPFSAPRTLLTSIASDLPNRPICFGPIHCDDDRLALSLENKGDLVYLHATLTPRGDDAGNVRTLVTIETDLESGYRLQLAAIGQIIPDLVALPIDKLSIRADLRSAQSVERAQSQYLLLTDHDRRRPAEFQIARLVDAAGNDATKNFEVTFEPVAGDERSRRMRLRWIGHAESEFRGEIVLTKDPEHGPFLPIEVVALHSPLP